MSWQKEQKVALDMKSPSKYVFIPSRKLDKSKVQYPTRVSFFYEVARPIFKFKGKLWADEIGQVYPITK